jgi:murein L,D-transpeptidase YcbB/YkuD
MNTIAMEMNCKPIRKTYQRNMNLYHATTLPGYRPKAKIQHSLNLDYVRWVFIFFLMLSFSPMILAQQVRSGAAVDSLTHAWDKTIPGNFSRQNTLTFDSTKIRVFLSKYPEFNQYTAQIKLFYQNRKFAYAWFEGGRLIEQAGNLLVRVRHLKDDGIYEETPYQTVVDSLLNGQLLQSQHKAGNPNLELMLTAQYFAFSKLAWEGMNSSASAATKWYLPRKRVSYNSYLDSILKFPSPQFAATEPVYRQYELLKAYLKRYRQLSSIDKWQPITKNQNPLVFSLAVRKRLYKLGDYKGDTLKTTNTKEISGALKHFQDRHGLVQTGLLDNATLSELNVPLTKRIQQILVNMERSRWLPVSLSGDYLAVNIPEYRLHVYHADSLLWSCNVVVGKTTNPTTVFYGEIKYVVFSPYWNIPNSIVRNEVLPGIKKNANYLAVHNMEITGQANGLPVIRQKPGPQNSLGRVKFLFPNNYNIYLHDTPSKSLFGENSRSFSHGCIRVSEPEKLAAFLLKDMNWNAEKIRKAMFTGKERTVTVDQKTPVFIAYFTAFTSRDGSLNFRKDIYHRDQNLLNMMIAGHWN